MERDGVIMDLIEILEQYGAEQTFAPGEVLFRQGAASDGFYYLREGRLGIYYEEEGRLFPLSEVKPGETVGELGAATHWPRTATVKAKELSRVIFVPETDFHRPLEASPPLAAKIVYQIGERLAESDAARISLSRSYGQAARRVEALSSEKERLEEFLRLREELASMIVHDLRNPLGVMSSGLRMLECVPVATDNAEHVSSVLELMERSVERMERLVNTLMDIARLEDGQMTLDLEPLDLRALIERTLVEEQPLTEYLQVSLETRLPTRLPQVPGDRDVIQRVLINLLDNALKFTPSGGCVWVEAGSEDGAKTVWVAVVDTGPGISPEERERIFEKFTQVQQEKGARRGFGLGLSFCRMAVEAHGGRIWVEDGPDERGSRFVLTLPRR